MSVQILPCHIFIFNDTATTEIYTLSLHDALPIFTSLQLKEYREPVEKLIGVAQDEIDRLYGLVRDAGYTLLFCNIDRKSTRLNSSHMSISYAVFCLKKKSTNGIHSSTMLDSAYVR